MYPKIKLIRVSMYVGKMEIYPLMPETLMKMCLKDISEFG